MTQPMSMDEYRKLGKTERREPRQHGEAENQAAFFKLLDDYSGMYPILRFVFAIPNGGHRFAGVAGQLRAEGVKAGIWDVCVPMSRHGHGGAWIENKFGDNKLTSAQAEFGEFIRSENYATKISYDCETSIKFLEWYLGIDLHAPIRIGGR